MINIRSFVVSPRLPESLEPLRVLAYNLWWSWNPPAVDLFRRLDVELWEQCGHNPVALLGQISQQRLERVARDDAYAAQLGRVMDQFYIYTESRSWFAEHFPEHRDDVIAYFSAEFGLHESMPIYSGGLGVLAGDHLKSASDLGIPLVGVGLLYRQGYFEQQLTQDGQQLEIYPPHDFHLWPCTLVKDGQGNPVRVSVPLEHIELHAQVWLVRVGRVRLYLLDTDVAENPLELRGITSRLYGGDHDLRIRQEIVLGIGGLRVLRACGIQPTVCHMNEGHAAFLALERIRQKMAEHKLSYKEARELATAGNLFTTHTPVPAGIDRFSPAEIERYLGWIGGEIGISMNELLSLGRENPGRLDETFCMAILALRLAIRCNGVSKLHGEVSRQMWRSCWPEVPRDEIPITHVTNGIHTRTWVNPDMAELLEQYIGPSWADGDASDPAWQRVNSIPDTELWRAHERRRERLITFARRRLRGELQRRGAPPAELQTADEVLDPKALTIGFARRFAPYKRATLLLRNPARLAALLGNPNRPVQFIFAGKAHPKDSAGKELIKMVQQASKRPEFRRRLVFLENYDTHLARELVQAVDVWLNNPIRPLEASGTSGMKVPANGGLNLSCLDGWWVEAYNGENGWAIGDGRVYDDRAYQDQSESEALYNLLESEIVPLFYDRTDDGLPRKWLARVKQSIRTIVPMFNTHRMLREYVDQMYMPAIRRYRQLAADHYRLAKSLAAWKEELWRQWHEVRILDVVESAAGPMKVGDVLPLRAKVRLGTVKPEQVSVEIYHGVVGPSGEISGGACVPMKLVATEGDALVYEGQVSCATSGQHGYAVHVLPKHPELPDRYEHGLVVWG